MNDSLIRTREIARAGLSTARKLLSDDLPLGDRFRERRPRAFSEEKPSSGVQRDVCESASKLAGSCSKLPREEDKKKRKKVMPIVICFTRQTVYHGHANSQLPPEKARTGRQSLNARIPALKLSHSSSPRGSAGKSRDLRFHRESSNHLPPRCETRRRRSFAARS
jgi:hypothetical protein